MQVSARADRRLSRAPVRPMIAIPLAFAAMAAYSTFSLFPEVEMASRASPSCPYPITCWAKTSCGSQSFWKAVDKAGWPSRAMAGSPCWRCCARRAPRCGSIFRMRSISDASSGRGSTKDFISSPTMCSASAADPPFPAMRSFPPRAKLSPMRCALASMSSRQGRRAG